MPEPMVDAPDVATAPPPPPPVTGGGDNLDTLAGLKPPAGLIDSLKKTQEQKLKSDAASEAEFNKRSAQDRARMDEAYKAEGIGPNELKPWDADQELAKRSHTPMEEFGSFASIFAIAASAFTHTPMDNALNGAAAAMNAIKKNDMDSYDKAFDTFKENSALALKRHALQHERYEDANKLLTTDMTTWRAKLQAAAERFGDTRMKAFLDAGMDKEAMEMQASSAKAALGWSKARDEIIESNLKMKALNTSADWLSRDPIRMLHARELVDRGELSPEQEFMFKYHQEHPDATAEKFGKAYGEFKRGQQKSFGSGNLSSLKAQRIEALHEAEPDRDQGDIIRQVETEFTKAAPPKAFTTLEMKTLSAAPDLMKHLETLDAFSSATGTISGLVQRLGAEYGGVNDPAIIWQTAKRQAEAALTELGSSGRISVVGLKKQLDTLPDDYRAARFGKYQVQEAMKDLRDKAQSELSVMEASGKKIPENVLQKFQAIGVYPTSIQDKDPLVQLRKDPTTVPDDALISMSHYMAALPLEDQQRIVAEAKRRKAAEGGQ